MFFARLIKIVPYKLKIETGIVGQPSSRSSREVLKNSEAVSCFPCLLPLRPTKNSVLLREIDNHYHFLFQKWQILQKMVVRKPFLID